MGGPYAVVVGWLRSTLILSSRLRAWAKSYAVWRFNQKSALDRPVFSSRMAISGEIAARPFNT